ncbi:hypothetical protein PIB30_049047 [Stylosanthes scabra]|uniref:Uncharacterized protein n=1 Tax=Stylosanthes scabra TaxID=79078 RepID=A0ABU6VFK2_9FABA|nr:hypothetical protein [Stylosanthes scabra]
MGSGIIYYEIEKQEKYEDSNERADSDLAIVKTLRYHFDDEPFIHPLHSVHFDPDRPYELPVESLLALRRRDPSKKKGSSRQESGPSRQASPTPQTRRGKTAQEWELIPPSKVWMYEGDDVEGKEAGEEVPERVRDANWIEEEEEEDPEEDAPRKRCMLFLVLWMWMPTRTIHSTWRSFNVNLSTLSSIVVRRLLNVPQMMLNLHFSMLIVSPVMIYPAFGRPQSVQVSIVPH